MKKTFFLFALLFFPFFFASAERCPDYCSGDTLYSKGSYNSRSLECEYTEREKCDYGCESRSGCQDKPEPKDCDNYCSRDTYYFDGEYDEDDDDCDYSKKDCPYGCDEKTGCQAETRAETVPAPEQSEKQDVSANETQTTHTASPQEQTASHNNEESTPPDVVVDSGAITKEEKSSTLSYENGQSEEKADVAGEGVTVSIEGGNITISGKGKVFVFENNFKDIQNRYLIAGRTIKKVEAEIEKDETGEEKPFYIFNLITPAKFLGLFRFEAEERIRVAAESGKEISIERPWWTLFTSEPEPEKLIPNYCQKNPDCQKYDDGNLCNGILYCNLNSHQCEVLNYTVVNCFEKESENGCQKNTCNPETGKCEMKAVADNQICDDENFCTQGDFCQNGKCLSGNSTCQCQNHSDCQKFEDDNLCNGTTFCNFLNGQCEINPVTKVYCPTAYDNECSLNTCNPKTGTCEMKPFNVGQSCEGTHPCVDSFCSEAGQCEGNWNFDKFLEDEKKCQCRDNSDCQKFEDGNLCNGILYCNKEKGTCELNNASLKYCQTVNDTEKQKNICQPETGECVMTKFE